jgi:hypothetical protein
MRHKPISETIAINYNDTIEDNARAIMRDPSNTRYAKKMYHFEASRTDVEGEMTRVAVEFSVSGASKRIVLLFSKVFDCNYAVNVQIISADLYDKEFTRRWRNREYYQRAKDIVAFIKEERRQEREEKREAAREAKRAAKGCAGNHVYEAYRDEQTGVSVSEWFAGSVQIAATISRTLKSVGCSFKGAEMVATAMVNSLADCVLDVVWVSGDGVRLTCTVRVEVSGDGVTRYVLPRSLHIDGKLAY